MSIPRGIIPDSLIVVSALLTLLGLLLLRLGLRGRRGTQPHCRGCDYLLVGIQSSRCPECGRELSPYNVVLGERRLRRSRALAGLALVLLAGVCVWGSSTRYVKSIDYYNYWPTAWVVKDALLSERAPALRAWKELGTRRSTGKLSGRREQQVVDVCLAEEAKPPGDRGPLHDEMVEHLAGLVSDGKLSAAETDSFFQGITWQSLQARPVVLQGNGIRCQIVCAPDWVSTNGWIGTQRPAKIWVDGVLMSWGFSSSRHGGWNQWPLTLPGQPPGEHSVTATWRFELEGPAMASPAWSRETSRSVPVRVAADSLSEGLVELDDPGLLDSLRSAISVEVIETMPDVNLIFDQYGGTIPPYEPAITYGGERPPFMLDNAYAPSTTPTLVAQLRVTNAPSNVAFDVCVLEGTQEYNAGTISLAKGGSDVFILGVPRFNRKLVKDLDVVLRSSPQAARDSVDVMEFWKGEIIFSTVKIRQVNQYGADAWPLPSLGRR